MTIETDFATPKLTIVCTLNTGCSVVFSGAVGPTADVASDTRPLPGLVSDRATTPASPTPHPLIPPPPQCFQTLLLLLTVLPTSHGQRTLFARLVNRVYSLFSNLIGGERLCPAGAGLIDLATLIPCGAELPVCPANLACQRVSTLCRNTLTEVTVSDGSRSVIPAAMSVS